MSATNPNPIEKSMVSVLVVANVGGGVAISISVGDQYPMGNCLSL
jgi:hypothetical protein